MVDEKHDKKYLEWWIDENQLASFALTQNPDFCAEASSHDVGLADNLLETCIIALRDIYRTANASTASKWEAHQIHELRRCLENLHLWRQSVCPLQRSLGESQSLHDTVLECLYNIGNLLASSHLLYQSTARKALPNMIEQAKSILALEDSTSDDEFNDSEHQDKRLIDSEANRRSFIQDAATFTECLMTLVPAFERNERSITDTPPMQRTHTPVAFDVTEPARAYVRQILDRFPNAPMRLAERLGEANWQRYVEIRRKMDDESEDVDAGLETVVVPKSKFYDSGLGTSVPALSSLAMSTASQSSFASSLAEKEQGTLRVPPAPIEVAEGRPFSCSICRRDVHNVKNGRDWKMHVFTDLTPYICSFASCKDELEMFSTRKLWADHEFSKHRSNANWRCTECFIEVSTPLELTSHLQSDHNMMFSERNLDSVLADSKNVREESLRDKKCPICLETTGDSRRSFITHVCRHMESIALAALPRDAESEIDEDSQSASDDRSDVKASNGHTFFEEEEDNIIKCFCASLEDDGNTVLCEVCNTWQHIECYYQLSGVPEIHLCVDCEPSNIRTRSEDKFPHQKMQPHPSQFLKSESPSLSLNLTSSVESTDPDLHRSLPLHLYEPQRLLASSSRHDESGKESGRCPNPECGKRFKDLKAHMLTHQAERPEKCPIRNCEYHTIGFARKYDKQRHTLTHYKGTMVCSFCPNAGEPAEKTFKRADVFKRHLTAVHGVEQLLPKARKKIPFVGRDGKDDGASSSGVAGTCSTCSQVFKCAQEFYEHLDECLLAAVMGEKGLLMNLPLTLPK